ncbi:hypothetical protein SERLADRAFT_441887 [Serpula lacrymans var. lacrymans S7.9]|nr:uncharacterized protein SERLADRAFT_441887 [Serpula lacrymans var. lacrymans S7.9]EGO20544.1 hypothetical protein SERLADRAFT_441887 [Serpula lacrymans var. lacrymans S7.9]
MPSDPPLSDKLSKLSPNPNSDPTLELTESLESELLDDDVERPIDNWAGCFREASKLLSSIVLSTHSYDSDFVYLIENSSIPDPFW